jgi:hypothetical protein
LFAGAIAVIGLIGVIVAATFTTDRFPLEPGQDRWSVGYITHGSKFGITVGRSIDSARKASKTHHLDYYGPTGCDKELNSVVDCRNNEKYYVFGIDTMFRHGLVYVSTDGSLVTGIIWNTHVLRQVDF